MIGETKRLVIPNMDIHKNFVCNNCNIYLIKDLWYHCFEYLDYNVCECCYKNCEYPHPLKLASIQNIIKEKKHGFK
jgi:hypothetical protein